MKRIISFILTAALVLSLSATALAAAPQDLVYDRDATLSASFVKYGNITVKSGVTLTIDKSSGFEVAGNITVEPGGKIVCNGVGSGDFTFSMCSQSATITGMDLYFNFRTENGIEVRPVTKGYEAIRAMWVQNEGMMAPAFKWNTSVNGWCLTGNTNINLSDEPVYHSERDMDTANQLADRLCALGLFLGDGNGYALEREGTRIEAIIMLIRLLGKEEVARTGNWKHPFTDVPAWADPYIGYAYETGLTAGVSATQFGTGNANAQMYFTFVLRALGKTDTAECNVYEHAFELMGETGLLSTEHDVYEICTRTFWRSDMAVLSYRALSAQTTSGGTLSEKLIADGVFTEAEYKNATR